MNPFAINLPVTIDDFDPVVSYSNQWQWTTPDPSAPDFVVTDEFWQGTYHSTNAVGATAFILFTGTLCFVAPVTRNPNLGIGSEIEVYGRKGPTYGSFSVTLDRNITEHTAFDRVNSTNSTLLFSATNLTYDRHALILTNLGPKTTDEGSSFLLDYVKWRFEAAPAG